MELDLDDRRGAEAHQQGQDQQDQEGCAADHGDGQSGGETGGLEPELDGVHARLQMEGDHRLAHGGDARRLAVNGQRPAVVIGDGGVDQARLLHGDRALDAGIADQGGDHPPIHQLRARRIKELGLEDRRAEGG